VAEDNSNGPQTVTRIDSQQIKDFGSNLKNYKHTDDWSQSGIDTGDDSYWQKKNLKTNDTKGLFAGDPHRTALYATGNAHETRYVEFTQNGQPIVYFDKKDLPKMRGRKTYLTVFDAANFKELPTGEYFSENPGKPLKQTVINDPFQYIADQGWIVRVTDDLNKVFKQVQSMHKNGKIQQYGAEGMDESVQQGVAEGYDNTTFGIARRKLNVPALIKAGALFVTYPHGEQGWETDNQEDWAFSLLSLYNVLQGGWPGEAKKYLKPASYKKAEQQINSSAPNLGSDKLVYDGKYNQILWSIKKLGIPDNIAFLDDGQQGIAKDDSPRIKLGGDSSAAKAWIERVHAKYPYTMQNNHVMVWGKGDDQQFAMFELTPSFSKRGAVEVKWIQAYPLRQGVGSRAMQELQAMAREDGISLTLFPWDKGQVSQSKLTKFYRGQGFTPTVKGSKSMQWEPK
jgi:hypothetical protein